MTMIKHTASRTVTGNAVAARAMHQVASAFAAAWTAYRNRRAVRRLHHLDDHLLVDIGLTRADLTAAEALPIHRDPSAWLAATVGPDGADTPARARPRRGK